LSFTESPHHVPKQRKHFEHQYRDQFVLGDCEPVVNKIHPLIRTSKAGQTRIQIDLSEEKPRKENAKSPLEGGQKLTMEKFFRKRAK
jgi:hypothetical protein